MVSASREIATKKDLQTRDSKQWKTLSTQNAENAFFLHERKGISRECVFRPLSRRNSLVSKMWELQTCPEALSSRVRAVCVSALFEPCNNNHRPLCDCPWKKGILPPSSSIQVHTQGVNLQGPRIFQTYLGSLHFSYRKKWWNRCFEVGLPLLVSVGTFLTVSASGEILNNKWPLRKSFPAMCVTRNTVCWEGYLPSR